MTPSRASRINGLNYEKDDGIWTATDSNGAVVASRKFKKNDKETLKLLVEDIYAINRLQVLAMAGYKCSECGYYANLECDHIVPRSRGRNDRIENLRILCNRPGNSCHMKRHGYKMGANS